MLELVTETYSSCKHFGPFQCGLHVPGGYGIERLNVGGLCARMARGDSMLSTQNAWPISSLTVRGAQTWQLPCVGERDGSPRVNLARWPFHTSIAWGTPYSTSFARADATVSGRPVMYRDSAMSCGEFVISKCASLELEAETVVTRIASGLQTPAP